MHPYDILNNRYVTTPIPAIFNIIFIFLDFSHARTIMFVLIPLSIVLGFIGVVSIFGFHKNTKDKVLISGAVCLFFGYPFYFLLERGNIDGWVFLFISLGLYLFQKPKLEWLSSLFFAFAIVFKIYPILVIIPFVLYRKWRLFFWLCFWLVILNLPLVFWSSDFQSTMMMRAQSTFRFDENGSLVATIALISLLLNALGLLSSNTPILFAPVISAFVYGIMLSLLIYADYRIAKEKPIEITSIIMYFPFMVALPQTVYHYSFIICLLLIPAMCYLWNNSNDKRKEFIIIVISIGISLTQWQSIATFNLTQNVLSHGIPGLGLLIIMLGICSYKLWGLRPVMVGGAVTHPAATSEPDVK